MRIALVLALLALGAVRADAVVTLVQSWVDGRDGVDGLALAQDVVVSPNGKHVYAVSEGENALTRFDRDTTTGVLTFVEVIRNGIAGVTGLTSANAVALAPDGAHLYVASGANAGAVAVFARNASTGALTFVEAKVNGQGGVSGLVVAHDVVVSPDGAHVYALGFTPGAILTFARDAGTGALTFVEKDEEGVNGLDGIGFATACVVSPDGAHLYVTGNADDSVAVFARNATTGALTFVEVERDGVNGVDGIDAPFALAISADGKHVYAGGADDDGLAAFARNATTGALTFVQAYHEGVGGVDGLNFPGAVAVTPDGGHVLVAASAESEIGVFARNVATGGLTFVESVGGSDLGTLNSLRFAPNGKHLYTTARAAGSVSFFTVAPAPPTTTTSTTAVPPSSTTSTTGATTTTTTAGGGTTQPPGTTTTSAATSSTVPGTTSSTVATPTSSSTSITPTTAPAATTTSSTTPPSGCALVPHGPTFASLGCRLDALRDETGTVAGLGDLRPRLGRALGKAHAGVQTAEGACSLAKRKPTRRRLGRVRRQLVRYARRLGGRAAQKTILPEVREPLAAAAAAIAADAAALRRIVACPGNP